MSRIISQRYVGKRQTYDIEVAHHDHQFYIANGLLTSNSHAISYALDSYMCAYLLTHHAAEWLCAYAEEYTTVGDKKRAQALSDIRALGYDIARVDINIADKSWTIVPGKKFMPSFMTIKSIGDAAVDEILRMRPYNDVYDLLWTNAGAWKHTKFNKRVMENLIKVGAFESLDIVGSGKYFTNYRHMYVTIVENWAELRKRGRTRLDELRDELSGTPDWTRDEKVEMYVQLVGALDVELVIPADVISKLRQKGVTSIDDAVEGAKAIHWFIVTDSRPMKTKTGKSYLNATCVGESGMQHKVNIWGWKPGGVDVRTNYGYLAEVEKNGFGVSTVPWKMREVT